VHRNPPLRMERGTGTGSGVQTTRPRLPMLRYIHGEAASVPRPALFLDRDGVLNRHIVDGYVIEPSDFEPIDVALEAATAAQDAGSRNDFRPGNLISIPRRKRRDEELRKLIEFDEDTFAKLRQPVLMVTGKV